MAICTELDTIHNQMRGQALVCGHISPARARSYARVLIILPLLPSNTAHRQRLRFCVCFLSSPAANWRPFCSHYSQQGHVSVALFSYAIHEHRNVVLLLTTSTDKTRQLRFLHPSLAALSQLSLSDRLIILNQGWKVSPPPAPSFPGRS